MIKVAPSILSADFAALGDDVNKVLLAGGDWVHIDVMDGVFVPNISLGLPVVKSLRKVCDGFFDVHLMIEDPDRYLEDFITDNTEYITVHAEACVHLHRTIQHIKSSGAKAGVAVNPATPLSAVECVLEDVDMILIMSVNPGFGGQKFISSVLPKIRNLDELRRENNLDFTIEIDGGINPDNVKTVTDAGVDIVVAGSSVFGAADIEARVKEFREILQK